jgi:excisionase family DNA binding protein
MSIYSKVREPLARQDRTAPNNPHASEDITILPQGPPLLTTDEVAEILRISPGRCRLACRAGRLPAINIGGRWRIPRTRLEVLLGGGGFEN